MWNKKMFLTHFFLVSFLLHNDCWNLFHLTLFIIWIVHTSYFTVKESLINANKHDQLACWFLTACSHSTDASFTLCALSEADFLNKAFLKFRLEFSFCSQKYPVRNLSLFTSWWRKPAGRRRSCGGGCRQRQDACWTPSPLGLQTGVRLQTLWTRQGGKRSIDREKMSERRTQSKWCHSLSKTSKKEKVKGHATMIFNFLLSMSYIPDTWMCSK